MSPWFFSERRRAKRKRSLRSQFSGRVQVLSVLPSDNQSPPLSRVSVNFLVNNKPGGYHLGVEDGLNSMLYRRNLWIQPPLSAPRRQARFEASPAMKSDENRLYSQDSKVGQSTCSYSLHITYIQDVWHTHQILFFDLKNWSALFCGIEGISISWL